jgi:hypothetical protein
MSQIYSIYYMYNALQKFKLNTIEDIAAVRHHNFTGNRLVVIAHLELLIEVLQFIFSF